MHFVVLLIGILPVISDTPAVRQDGGSWHVVLPLEDIPTLVFVDGYVSNSRMPETKSPVYSKMRLPEPIQYESTVREYCEYANREIILSHNYGIASKFEPLLGFRWFTAKVAGSLYLSFVDMTSDSGKTRRFPLDSPLEDMRDYVVYNTPPYSVAIDSDATQLQYRIGDIPLRPGKKYKLTYNYMYSRGADNAATSSIAFYRDELTGWIVVSGIDFEHKLWYNPHWKHVEFFFSCPKNANQCAVSFRSKNFPGTLWVDDVTLEPAEREERP